MKNLTGTLIRFITIGIFSLTFFAACRSDHFYPDPMESSISVPTKKIFILGNDTLRYQIYLPEDLKAGKKYPVLLYCHGAEQRGNDNESQMADFPKLLLTHFGRAVFSCYIIAPQVPLNQQWVNVPWTDSTEIMPDSSSTVEMLTVKLLDSLINYASVDTNRIYVTGLSMGGFATWDLICRYPHKFAAALPIAGGGDETQASKLTAIPIWAFHGALDDIVIPSRSINMVNAVNAAGGNAKLTLYPNEYHGGWDATYKNPEVLKWIFQQSK